jgi:hypothetical protein
MGGLDHLLGEHCRLQKLFQPLQLDSQPLAPIASSHIPYH